MMNFAKAVFFSWLLISGIICHVAYAEPQGAGSAADEIVVTPILQSRTTANNQLKYFIVVEGTTGLPAQAIIKVNLYYAFPLEANDPTRVISIMDRARILDTKKCRVKESKYAIDFGPFGNTPPPGDYYITVTYDPEQQLVDVKSRADKEISNYQFLNLGGFKEATEYRESVIKEIRQKATNVKQLFREVRAFALDNLTRPVSDTAGVDKKIIQQWLFRITGATDEIIKSCTEQDEYRIFGSVSMSKNMAAGLADSLKALANTVVDTVNQLPAQRNAELLKKDIEAFGMRMEEDLVSLGWVKPFNRELLARTMKDIRLFMNSTNAAAIPSQISTALLALNEELSSSYYDTIAQLASSLTEWAKTKPDGRNGLLRQKVLQLVETLECLLHDHNHDHQKEQEAK